MVIGSVFATSIKRSTAACGTAIASMPFLKALPEKISEKLGAMTAVIPMSSQRPGGMLAARSAAEIVARDQDRGTGIFRIVENIALLGTDRFESALAQAPRARSVFSHFAGMMTSVSTFF